MHRVIKFGNYDRLSTFDKTYILKSRTIIYHVLFWLGIYLLWVLIFRSYSVPITKTITVEFCYLIFITATYYTIGNFIIPQFLVKKKYILFALGTLAIILISGWLRALVAVQVNHRFFHTVQMPDFGTLFFLSATNIAIWVLLITVGKMIFDRIQTQQQLEQLEQIRIKNELDYLKAQINPHALFNSLNTIYGHIDKTNKVARNTLLQFSELLRYQLYDCSAPTVTLQKEIDYIKNYIEFQRLRKDEKLVVSVDIENVEPGLEIAPLLLLVLIENAFKFVSNFSDKENKITIRISANNQVLQSSFMNTTEPQFNSTTKTSGGIGLSNLMRRLELLYPHKHELKTNISDDSYETHLTINLQ